MVCTHGPGDACLFFDLWFLARSFNLRFSGKSAARRLKNSHSITHFVVLTTKELLKASKQAKSLVY
jgi:hypothetical protein